jgi:signal transduction histidine kinase
VATAATLVVVVTVFAVARADPTVSFEHRAGPAVLAMGLAACLVIAVALWVTRATRPHRAVALGAVIAGCLLPVWAGFEVLPPSVRATLVGVASIAVGGVALLASRTTRIVGGRPLAVVWGLAAVAAVVHVSAYDPFADPSCQRVCVHVEPIAGGLLTTTQALTVSSVLTVVASGVAAATVGRRRPGELAALGLLGAEAAWRWAHRRDATPDPNTPLLLVVLAMLVLGFGIVTAAWRTRSVRRELSRLTEALTMPTTDPTAPDAARVQFALPGEQRWVDIRGQDVEDSETGRWIHLADENGPLARIPATAAPRTLDARDDLPATVSLGLRNARLTALANARLREVQESQHRLEVALEAERHRIERDLHDGAQQRLVTASFFLNIARPRIPAATARLDAAESDMTDALVNLREIAHGLTPRDVESRIDESGASVEGDAPCE